MMQTSLTVVRGKNLDDSLTNEIIKIIVHYTLNDGMKYDWDFSDPSIIWINKYISESKLELDDVEHFGQACRVAQMLSYINPLIVASDEDSTVELVEDMIVGRNERITNQIHEEAEQRLQLETAKNRGQLH